MKMQGTRKDLLMDLKERNLTGKEYRRLERSIEAIFRNAPWGVDYTSISLPQPGSYMKFRKSERGEVIAHIYPGGNPAGYLLKEGTVTKEYRLLDGMLNDVKQFLRNKLRELYPEYELFGRGNGLGPVTGEDDFIFGLSKEGQGLLQIGTIYVAGKGDRAEITITPDEPCDRGWSGSFEYPTVKI